MKYKIEVHSLGYEDTSKIVEASSLREAKKQERQAKLEWCEHNDIDLDSSFELPFTRTSRVSECQTSRVGKIDPRYLHISDVDKIIAPHGEAAQDALDRDLSMDSDDFGSDE